MTPDAALRQVFLRGFFAAVLSISLVTAAAASDDALAQSLLQRLQVQSGAPGVSGAVLVGGKIVFSGGAGAANLESGLAQTGTTVHNIGSISKTLGVVAVMQLVEQGKVDLDAEIQRYAPWFPRKQKPITVRQILTHTSGIRHYKDGEFGPAEVMSFRHYDQFEESTRYWRDDPLLFAPGTHWSYSSYAANLMQAIVESASGQPFETYLAQHVWGPAGMVNTQFDIPSRIVARRGKGYEHDPKNGELENARNEDVSYKYAGGGMLSTDEDLCRFGHALNTGVLLKPATLAEMYRLQLPKSLPRFEKSETKEPPIGDSQGLIFFMNKDSRGRLHAGHSGGVKGTLSEFYNYFKEDVVVAMHFNADSGSVDLADSTEALASLFMPPVPPRTARATDDSSRAAAIDAVFSDMQQGAPGAAVGIYQKGRLIFARGYGTADIEHGVPVTPDTAFNLASVSKQFTGLSIALLAREGKVDLQADIRTYLPDMPDVGEKVTVYDLVHHISGLRDYMALGMLSGHDDESLVRQAQAANLLKAQRSLNFPPGTRYQYSNSGYMILAEIVKAVSGKSLHDFMQERIFQPLGMTHTRLHDSLNTIEPGYAVGYEPGEGNTQWTRAVYNRVTTGPGNVLSTVGDLTIWLGNFANPKVGDRALIDQLSAPATLRNGEPVNYGFGLSRQSVIGHRVISHSGGISGFATKQVYFPDDDFGIVVLANHPIELDAKIDQLARIYLEPKAEKVATGKRDATSKESSDKDSRKVEHVQPSAESLASVVGAYYSDEIDTTYRASVENGRLTLRSLYLVGPQTLTPTTADHFTAADGPLEDLNVAVERGGDGKATGLSFDYHSLHGLRLRKVNDR